MTECNYDLRTSFECKTIFSLFNWEQINLVIYFTCDWHHNTMKDQKSDERMMSQNPKWFITQPLICSQSHLVEPKEVQDV